MKPTTIAKLLMFAVLSLIQSAFGMIVWAGVISALVCTAFVDAKDRNAAP